MISSTLTLQPTVYEPCKNPSALRGFSVLNTFFFFRVMCSKTATVHMHKVDVDLTVNSSSQAGIE
jgi:hypothetical protein